MEQRHDHRLKCWPVFYADIVNGSKTFELRRDDRGFQVGDLLILQEWDPEDEEYGMYQQMIETRNQGIIDAIQGVDLLIADSAYTEAEYPQKKGWGHGTLDSAIRLGQQAGAGQVCLSHHEPTRDDDSLETVFAEALHRCQPIDGGPKCLLAREGLTIEL